METNWNWKQCIALLCIEFIGVVYLLKLVLQSVYTEWIDNDLYAGILTGMFIAIILMGSLYVIALRPGGLSFRVVGFRDFDRKHWKLILIYTVILFIGSAILMVLTSLIGNTWENSKTDSMQENMAFLPIILALLSASVISPLYEEIFYRGFLYTFFKNRFGVTYGVIISATIFTFAHIPTYNAMPVNFLGGVIFALAYERTKSIWPPILIHGIVNAVAILLTISG